jgi:hypothetical protein
LAASVCGTGLHRCVGLVRESAISLGINCDSRRNDNLTPDEYPPTLRDGCCVGLTGQTGFGHQEIS